MDLPSGEVSAETGVAIQQLRGASELSEAMGESVVIHGGKKGPWTVVYEPGGAVEPSCLHRTVRVIPVDSVYESVSALARWTPHLQTVGVVGLGEERALILERLARLGVSRISTLA